MHEALYRPSGTTLDIVHDEGGPPITQRILGLELWPMGPHSCLIPLDLFGMWRYRSLGWCCDNSVAWRSQSLGRYDVRERGNCGKFWIAAEVDSSKATSIFPVSCPESFFLLGRSCGAVKQCPVRPDCGVVVTAIHDCFGVFLVVFEMQTPSLLQQP